MLEDKGRYQQYKPGQEIFLKTVRNDEYIYSAAKRGYNTT